MIEDTIKETEVYKEGKKGFVYIINIPWHWIVKKFELTHKNRSFVAVLIIIIFAFLYLFLSGLNNRKDLEMKLASVESDLKLVNSQKEEKEREIENLKSENKELRDKIQVFGYSDGNEISSLSQNVEDFRRDWNYSESFYVRNTNEFCPRLKGLNNYQRVPFKRETPLAGGKMELKFKMVDEVEGSDYDQRFVVGLRDENGIISEFDIPTRNGQTVNFRENTTEGTFDSIQDGKEISSPIREGSIINLIFETAPKHDNEITETVTLDYLSKIEKYGGEGDSISYDKLVNDTHPENSPATVFIGSYVGGCIQVIDWKVS